MENLSPRALKTLEFLGDFEPTSDPSKKAIKGWFMLSVGGRESQVYLNAKELRDMAGDFLEVADWLERRANNA